MTTETESTKPTPLARIEAAINGHDLAALVACFAADYQADFPAHPQRNFVGAKQVRQNWTEIFGRVPNISARLIRSVEDGERAWGEWAWEGTRQDGAAFAMAGVTLLEIAADRVAASRFYMEPVDSAPGDVAADVRRLVETEVAR
ncbi:MAG: nuclear transport factor 2 family protein [Tepidiformaceae bacterium]